MSRRQHVYLWKGRRETEVFGTAAPIALTAYGCLANTIVAWFVSVAWPEISWTYPFGELSSLHILPFTQSSERAFPALWRRTISKAQDLPLRSV